MALQIGIPLGLHMRSEVTFNLFTNERWKPGEKYQESRTINELGFLLNSIEHGKAVRMWATLIRILYEHPDWSQVCAFFSKRYGKAQMLSDRSARRLTPPPDETYMAGKSITASFLTDPSTVGFPKDLLKQLAEAERTSSGSLIGPDPKNASIGPAISVAVGAGAWMDLMYGGNPPGGYAARPAPGTTVSTARKGGRGRTLSEWRDVWTIIADWVYEHEATSLANHFLNMHSYKYRLDDAESAQCYVGGKVPRKFLSTDPIDGADGVRDCFAQLAEDPVRFHGMEWDFLQLQVKEDLEEAFYRRFGKKDPDMGKRMEGLTKDVSLHASWGRLAYSEVPPVNLKRCPETFRGADWEQWLLSVEGGDVVGVNTIFQALWAVMLLTQLPVTIKILDKDGKFPQFRDPECVYI